MSHIIPIIKKESSIFQTFLAFLMDEYWMSGSWERKASSYKPLEHFCRNIPYKHSMGRIFSCLETTLTHSTVGFCIQCCFFWEHKSKMSACMVWKMLSMYKAIICSMVFSNSPEQATMKFNYKVVNKPLWSWNKAEKPPNSQVLKIPGLEPLFPSESAPKGKLTSAFYSGLAVSGRCS